jgi:hypothetical protein
MQLAFDLIIFRSAENREIGVLVDILAEDTGFCLGEVLDLKLVHNFGKRQIEIALQGCPFPFIAVVIYR